MRWPIRYQILVPFAAVTGGCVVGLTILSSWQVGRMVRHRVEQQLRDVASTVRRSNFPLTLAVLEQMKGLSGAEFVVTLEDGTWQTSTLGDSARPPLPKSEGIVDWRDIDIANGFPTWNDRFLHIPLRLQGRNDTKPGDLLHILYPVQQYHSAWWRAVAVPLIFGLTSLAIAMGFGWLVARKIGRAVGQLRSKVARIAGGELILDDAAMVPRTGGGPTDELTDLSADIGTMAGKLADFEQQSRRRERMHTLAQIAAGIAHEIRNSTTGCRMAVDLHAQECRTPAAGESLAVARRQLSLIEAQLQRFLQLGGPDAGTDMQPCDVGQIISDTVDLIRPAARHAGVRLHWSSPVSGISILADWESVARLLINLLLNAVEAAAEAATTSARPAEVDVSLSVFDRRARIQVRDSGNGPPISMQDCLFEPFSTSKKDGVGLGLSLAKQIVERHGGIITWDRADDRTQFLVEIPLLSEGQHRGEHPDH